MYLRLANTLPDGDANATVETMIISYAVAISSRKKFFLAVASTVNFQLKD